MKKLLQVVGALALAGWTVAGLAAWVMTKDQIHVVVSADDPGTGPDPVALLQDEVTTLARDLSALTETLGANFSILDGRVSDALARPAAAPADPKAAAAEVERALRVRIAELEARLDVLELALRSGAAAPGLLVERPAPLQIVEIVEGPATSAAEPEPEPEAAVAQAEPEPQPATAAAEPEPAPKASFLAFSLPSQSFEPDARRHWTIVGSLSRVGFDGKSSLHDFTGATSAVEGELVANPEKPADRPSGKVVVDATKLGTGLDDRDEAMHEHLSSAEFPSFEFQVRSFEAGGTAQGATRGTVRGTMKIHGTEREFAMPVELSLDASHRLVIEGNAPLKMSDYGVPVPNKLGLVKMEDEVDVWITLRARPGSVVE